MIAIVAAVVAMAARDAIGTLMTVAEARGRAKLAGILDAAGDLAGVICTVVGAGAVIKGGLTVHTVEVLGAMMFTSLVGTTYWTKLGRRIKPSEGE